MHIHCPACGSSNVRHSRSVNLAGRLLSLAGRQVFRCRECRLRFRAQVWRLRDLIYARCPDCFCEALARWSPSHYGVSLWAGFRLLLGAQPYYCARCRRRFVSFRPRKRRAGGRRDGQGGAASAPVRRAANG